MWGQSSLKYSTAKLKEWNDLSPQTYLMNPIACQAGTRCRERLNGSCNKALGPRKGSQNKPPPWLHLTNMVFYLTIKNRKCLTKFINQNLQKDICKKDPSWRRTMGSFLHIVGDGLWLRQQIYTVLHKSFLHFVVIHLGERVMRVHSRTESFLVVPYSSFVQIHGCLFSQSQLVTTVLFTRVRLHL